jgi:hypothetical protein
LNRYFQQLYYLKPDPLPGILSIDYGAKRTGIEVTDRKNYHDERRGRAAPAKDLGHSANYGQEVVELQVTSGTHEMLMTAIPATSCYQAFINRFKRFFFITHRKGE